MHPADPSSELARNTGFVGRDRELAHLIEALETRPGGDGPVRLLLGNAGVGKTRLAEELSRLAVAAGTTVVWGHGGSELAAPPFWVWTQIVRALQDRPLVGDLAELVLDEGPVDRFALFDATATAVLAAARDRRLLVVLDDLHATDPATLQLTRFVTRRLRDAPVLVVATVRTVPSLPSDVTEQIEALGRFGRSIELVGLDPDAVGRLVGRADRAEVVHAVTGGNPLFVHQVLRSLPNVSSPGLDGTDVTAALGSAIDSRVRSLGGVARHVLAAAAAWASPLDLRRLAELAEPADPAEVAEAARALVLEGFLTGDDTVSVNHPLVARVAVDGVDDEHRRRLHRRCSELIGEDPTRIEELSHHLLRAGPDHLYRAVEITRRAAALALQASAHEDAVAHLRQAIDHLDGAEPSLRLDVLLDLGGALWRSGRTAEADETYEKAWAEAVRLGDPESLARAALRDGLEYYFADHSRPAAAERAEAALAAYPRGDSPTRSRLLAEKATHHLSSTIDVGRRLAAEALEMARRFDDPVALGSALIADQVTDLGPATLSRRIAGAREILACARRSGDHRLAVHGRFLLMGALLESGDIAGLDGELLRYDGLAEEIGEPRFDRFALWLRSTRAMLNGDVVEAERLAERTLATSTELGDPDAFGVYGGQIGVLLWMRGRVQEMESVYSDLRASQPHEPLWPSVLGWIAATHGEADAARGALDAVPDPATIPSGMHWLLTATTYAETAALVGSDDQVEAAWNALVPYADRMVPIAMGAAVWGTVAKPLGHLALRRGELDDGLRYLRTAVHTCARLGARPWMIEAQLDLADALHRHRPADPAIATLRSQAHAAATRLGLDLFLRRAEADPPPVASIGARSSGGVPDTRRAPGRPRVRVIGGFEVVDADGTTARWTSRKARELLKILVSRRGAPVGREVLMDMLWPGEDPDVLSNRLSVALSTVRRALDPARTYPAAELVSVAADAVALNLDVVAVDAEELIDGARRLVSRGAELDDAATLAEASALLDVHRGEALPDEPHSDWATGLRDEVRVALVRLARAVGASAERGGDHLGAVEAHRRVLDLDPYDEAAHRGLVAAFRAIGAHGQAATAAATYRQRMAELGIDIPEDV